VSRATVHTSVTLCLYALKYQLVLNIKLKFWRRSTFSEYLGVINSKLVTPIVTKFQVIILNFNNFSDIRERTDSLSLFPAG